MGIINMTYVFDIDGTICYNTGGNYDNAYPFVERVKKVNMLFFTIYNPFFKSPSFRYEGNRYINVTHR